MQINYYLVNNFKLIKTKLKLNNIKNKLFAEFNN